MPAGMRIPETLLSDILTRPDTAAQAVNMAASTLMGPNAPLQLAAFMESFLPIGGDVSQTLGQTAQLSRIVDAISQEPMPGEGAADIWPGRRHGLPVSDATWFSWSAAPAVSLQ